MNLGVRLLGFLLAACLIFPALPLETSIMDYPDSTIMSPLKEEEYIDPSEWFVNDTTPTTAPQPTETVPPETVSPETVPPETEPVFPPNPAIWFGEYRPSISGERVDYILEEPVDREFLAKLVFAEAATMGWWGQVYVCSAIINHCEVVQRTLWECGHDVYHFSVAPFVDEMEPTEFTYEVVDYVLGGGKVEDICYFRTSRYHWFGTPVCQIENIFFSME